MPADVHHITVQALDNVVLTCRCGWYEDLIEDPPLWEVVATARAHTERPCQYCGQTVEACGTSKRGCCPDCSNRGHPMKVGDADAQSAAPFHRHHRLGSDPVGGMNGTSPNPDAYVKRIMRSPRWNGSVVIEAFPDGHAEVWWKASEQGRDADKFDADAVGPTVLDALARAAADADSLAEQSVNSPVAQ